MEGILNDEISKYLDIIQITQNLNLDLSLMKDPSFVPEKSFDDQNNGFISLDFNGTLFS